MTRPKRAIALWKLCRKALRTGVPGDFVECGVWMGGSAGLMAVTLKQFDGTGERILHLFDSFEGLPEPGREDGEKAAIHWTESEQSEHRAIQRCVAGTHHVEFLLQERLRFPGNRVVFHKGWFQQVLPNLGIEPQVIAVLRLDGDWYDSTKICFDHLYDRVATGGVVILDDYYCWEGCQKATDEFRAARGIKEPLVRIDNEAVYWIKVK